MARRKNPAAVALGRRGGKATSDAKTAAARKNARLGGRPNQLDDAILTAIRRAGPRRHADLKRALPSDPSVISRALRRLLEAGRIVKTDDGYAVP